MSDPTKKVILQNVKYIEYKKVSSLFLVTKQDPQQVILKMIRKRQT